MFFTLTFLGLLWLLAAFLRWLFRERLPKRLQTRWILIVSAVSAFVLAETELVPDMGNYLHGIYFLVLAASWFVAWLLMPRLREQMINVAILLILLVPAISFVYLKSDLKMVLYYLLATVTGVLLYLSFRSDADLFLTISIGDGQDAA